MERIQVKYCYNLDELNEFLKTLNINNKYGPTKYPCLANVQYLPKVYGNGVEKNFADEEGITASADVGCDIAAVVQYFIDIPEEVAE